MRGSSYMIFSARHFARLGYPVTGCRCAGPGRRWPSADPPTTRACRKIIAGTLDLIKNRSSREGEAFKLLLILPGQHPVR